MTNETPHILITAAGGKVGQHVAKQLSDKGVAARAGFHSQDKAAAPQPRGIEGVVLDFENPETIAAAFKGIDTLFLVTPGSPYAARQEERLLAEARKVGVGRVVKLSGKIAEHHTVGFGVWNTEAERQIKNSGIPYTILRGNFFMQNLFGSADPIKQGAFTMGPAAKKIALLDARDVAAVAVAALTEPGHSGQTYDLNGPELLDGHAQALVFSEVLGRPVKYLDVSAPDFIENLKKFGLPGWLVEAFGVAAADAEVPGDQSSATVARILRRKPGSLAQFVRDYRSAFDA
ncbi:NAD(P)H-binding protein [Dyella sp. GSA-30]|uniref:NAD(P)H-binding protein n=1 Tax=Dyella sp. GSA-30 TaxID=2994496 RepID=UPI00249165A8|nr:NAD(P)H-binding protein [Dyella sp. GSA-30]BDU21649.1 NAD(P)-dependent oxidoreductase [Dyella sp. GSA-30]